LPGREDTLRGPWIVLSGPFAWDRVESLRAGWGRLALEGERAGTFAEWRLEPGRSGLSVRPFLSDSKTRSLEAARAGDRPGDSLKALAEEWEAKGAGAEACWALTQAAWALAFEKRWPQALAALDRAESLAPSAGLEGLPAIQIERGNLLRKKGDLAEAGAAFARAASAVGEAFGESDLWRAECLYRQGAAAWVRRDLAAAEAPHREALAIRRRVAPGSPDEAESLNSLGGIAFARADFEGASALYREALAVFEKADPGGVGTSKVLSNLGSVHRNLGDLPEAQGYVERALEIQRRLDPGSLVLANSLNNLGLIAHEQGDLVKAEACHREALALREKSHPEGPSVAASLNNLAGVAESRGDALQAEAWYARAVALMEKKAPNSLDLASCLSNLGAVLGAQGKVEEARRTHLRALAMEEALAPGGAGAAGSHYNLGMEALRAGDRTEARSRFETASALFRRSAPGGLGLAGALVQSGLLRLGDKDPEGARPLLEEALALRSRLAPGSLAEAESMRALGGACALEGRGEAAIRWSLQALDALDSQMGRLGGSHEVRAEYRSGALPFYEEAMDRLLDAGRGEEAFAVFERARARVFLEILGERGLRASLRVPPELDRERRRLDRAHGRVLETLAEMGESADPEEWKSLTVRLSEIRSERASLAAKVRQASPSLAALAYPRPLGAKEVGASLPDGTCLLAYSVGETRTRLFVLDSKGGFRWAVLPAGREDLAKSVRAFRDSVLDARIPGRSSWSLSARGKDLADLLLVPAGALADPARHLVIVPDGPLHALPFAALPTAGGAFLGARKSVSVSPSATAFSEMAGGDQAGARRGAVAAFCWTGATDGPRGPLAATLPEAEGLKRLGGEARVFSGGEATEKNFRDWAGRASALHFACHAVLDARDPMNSCLLLEGRPDGRPSEDGQVRAWEVLEEVRTEARLAVLSACETGLGAEVAGEGLLGLVRAFHGSGTPTVVASLWKVEDASTAKLMGSFYGHLAGGLPPAEALRRAQAELREGKATGLPLPPFYWAAFQVYGRGE
jgi:CHAT domain-containing protein/tetratricopeptide (TPR) repeat protein